MSRARSAGLEAPATAGLPPQQAKTWLAGDPGLETGATGTARAGVSLALIVCCLLTLTACREDMQQQPRINPLGKSDFFGDNRSARPLIEGTVARGHLRTDAYFYTGKQGNDFGDLMPYAVTREVLERGRERYNIYCAPCHARTGDGNGMIVQRGYRRPPSYHIDRLRAAPVGQLFDVITNGFGAMPDYAAQVSPYDRWAIVAYLRALQLSQNAPAVLAPAGTQLSSAPPPAEPSSGNLPAGSGTGEEGRP